MNNNNQIVQVKIEDIVANKYQPRVIFNEEELNELAQSIKQYGIIQPLTLRPKDNKYEIVAGERRYRASILAGLTTVPAIITDINDNTSAELALIENIQRKNLNPIEEARSYERILNNSNISQEELAEKIGKSQSNISNKLRLLKLDPEIQSAVLDNKISERHARKILQLENPEDQKEILKEIIEKRLTVKLTEELINSKYKNKENITDLVDISKYLIGDEKKMNEQNNNITQQITGTIPETPIPTPLQPQNNSIFNNNFFPSLEDETTNMNMTNINNNEQDNPINQTISEPTQPQTTVDPWVAPNENMPNTTMSNNSQIQQNNQETPTQNNINESFVLPNQESLIQPTFENNNINVEQSPQNNVLINENNQPESNNDQNNFGDATVQNNNFFETPTTNTVINNNEQITQNLTENNNNNLNTQPDLLNNQMSVDPNNNTIPVFIDKNITNTIIDNGITENNSVELLEKIKNYISSLNLPQNKIQFSEIDFDEEYQIIIKITK